MKNIVVNLVYFTAFIIPSIVLIGIPILMGILAIRFSRSTAGKLRIVIVCTGAVLAIPVLMVIAQLLEAGAVLSMYTIFVDENEEQIDSEDTRDERIAQEMRAAEEVRQELRKKHEELYGPADPSIDPCTDGICPHCRSTLFSAIPRATSKEDIQEFARNSNRPDAAELEEEAWIHPGLYCSNGCTEIYMTFIDEEDGEQ